MPSKADRTSRGMRLVSYCPVCEQRSKTMMARVLGAEGDTKLMHVKCHKCHNAFLALVLVNQVGASSIGLLTDLAYEDAMKFQSHQGVSINDVISVHERMEKGAFLSCMSDPRKRHAKSTVKSLKKKIQK